MAAGVPGNQGLNFDAALEAAIRASLEEQDGFPNERVRQAAKGMGIHTIGELNAAGLSIDSIVQGLGGAAAAAAAAAAARVIPSPSSGGGGGGGGAVNRHGHGHRNNGLSEAAAFEAAPFFRSHGGGGAAAAAAARDPVPVNYYLDWVNQWLNNERVQEDLNGYVKERGFFYKREMQLNEDMKKLLKDPSFRKFLASDFEKALRDERGSAAQPLPKESVRRRDVLDLFLKRVSEFCVHYGNDANPPGKLLGGRLMFFDVMHAYDTSFLKENNIGKLVSLNVDLPLDHPGIETVAKNVPDNRQEGTPQAFLVGLVEAAREVVQGLRDGKRVGINCSEGRNRSALVCHLSHMVYDIIENGAVRAEPYVKGKDRRLGGRLYRPSEDNETLVENNWGRLISAIRDPGMDLKQIQWKV